MNFIIFIAYLVSTYQIWLCLPFKLLSEVGCFSDQNSDGILRRILKSFTSPTEEVDMYLSADQKSSKLLSMTSLLTHTVAHFTRSSFTPKINKLVVSRVKVVKNGKILTCKVNFLCQKLSESFSIFFSLKNINLGACFLLLTFFENFNF